jgi:ligand-binding sensor domain-containing protein/serine phosphatase RsbU (regulator of sigma subunit)
MFSKRISRLLLSTLSCLVLFSALTSGQSYRFRNYGSESKIPDKFVYTIVQDNNGYLWVGTGRGLSRFDGFDFYNISFPDSSSDRYPTASLKDKNGNLWFGCQDGSVYYSEEAGLKQASSKNERAVVAMLEGPDKFIYIFPQVESVLRINPDDPTDIKTYSLDQGIVIFSACFTPKGEILLGTQENISICSIADSAFKVTGTISGFDYSSVTAINRIGNTDKYLAGTNGNGLFKISLDSEVATVSRFLNASELEAPEVQSITEDSDKNLLVSTNGSGVFHIKFSASAEIENIYYYNKNSGLEGNNARIVYQDMEDNYWIGLSGDGLSILNTLSFSLYTPGTTIRTNDIIYIHKFDNDFFLGTQAGYWIFNPENGEKSFEDLKSITGKYEILSYCVDFENNIWIGTNGGGVYVKDGSGHVRQFYMNGNSSEDKINDIGVDKKYVWLGTLNGVIILNREGSGNKFKSRYDNTSGLPHNSINKIFLRSDGKAAIAMITDRLYTIDPETGIIQGKAVMYGTTRNEIVSFCETKDGHLWASTKGNGIFEFYNDSLRAYSREDLLMSDYCYSIIADSLDRIWIGHDSGFSLFDRSTGMVRTFGNDYLHGGMCNPGGMYESPDGKVFIGTTGGFIIYDRSKDKSELRAPLNNINYVSINDSIYPLRSSYSLPYKKRYNIVISYTGISLKNPERVYYQTILENYDEDWSNVTLDRQARYTPGEGKYRFMMKSVSENGLSDDNPVMLDISIRKPFWRLWWFILSIAALVASVVVLIVGQREKAQKKIQEYLEKELEARTSVVLKQKDKIELQNIEITDSINYAKRIQTSILPDFVRLQESFNDAFLLFRPRDIVSGDFYWFDKLDDDRFILVCADSTGHGVPGAFMSMIGSTLLQDIVTRQQITKPSEVLKLLDRQIFSTLNQNVELGISNDGMDMVVCEINSKKRFIRFASAMRPVILVLGGEPLYIKGNRCSVGGESVIEKYFDDQEYYLNEGDSLYMFSDGIPDQFGGTDGKKMKIARLKKLIEDVNNLPMSGQMEVIMKFYDEWKGEYEQVDDILMIGIRL